MQIPLSVFVITLSVLCASTTATLNNCTINTNTCKDKAGTVLCDATFGATNGEPDECFNNTIVVTIQKCLKTCALCCNDPQYNCRNKADLTGGVNCTTLAEMELCDSSTDPDFQALIADQCAGACGLCLSGQACPDTDPTLCQALATMCWNMNYFPLMEEKCKQTCGFDCDAATTTTTTTSTTTTSTTTTSTTTGTGTTTTTTTTGSGTITTTAATTTAAGCVDLATNCAVNVGLCLNPTYKALMMNSCARTCGYCATATTCIDTNPNCAVWVANGFCTQTFYTIAEKRQNCGRSCGLC